MDSPASARKLNELVPGGTRLKSTFITAVLGLSSLAAGAQVPSAPLTTIESLDVPRYMGTWYEIAKFPNAFQKKCVSDTRAEYSIRTDGTIQVINRCKILGGEIDEAIGTARQVGPATSPMLKVRFAPAWLSFLPFVWGDYWIIDLDPKMQLVAVSEPQRQYLWVLSRTPKVDPAAYEALLGRLAGKGFDLGRLEPTPQE